MLEIGSSNNTLQGDSLFHVRRSPVSRPDPISNRPGHNNSARLIPKHELAAERIAGPESHKPIGQQQRTYREYLH